ncbi:RE1 [Symbiodinium sp. CCMP2592]|nr:RE1 [Symbiodinium sp. CCMP2592]
MPPGSGSTAPAAENPASSSSPGGQGAWKDREPPPAYDGKFPEKTFARWLKELKLWEFETEVPKNKWGAKLLRQLTGPARAAADGLTFEEVACEKGMENVLTVLKEHFAPHLETSLPKAMEAAIYGEVRSGREGFAEYVIRMEHAFKELEREGVTLPPVAAGYIIYRHANLTETQDNQLVTWCEGKYDKAVIVKNLRKLEKVVHDKKKVYFGEGEGEDGMMPDEESAEIYSAEVVADYESEEDDDYVYVSAGELQDVYDEEEMQEALATYQEVRRSLRDQRNARGFYPVKFSGGKVHIDMLKLRTRCARCGCLGHWAKECRNPPDSRGRQNEANQRGNSSGAPSSSRSGFFVSGQSPGSSSTFFGSAAEKEGTMLSQSYVPLFDHVMNAVCRKRAAGSADTVCPREDQGKSASPDSFIGVVTSSTEGIVDTADGLIGKPAMLRLTEALRSRGLKIRWNGKRAQATGVGGKATVIGVVEAPVGIAGINGLLEMTVVQEDIPMLLPIKLLRQLRAVVDLDRDVLDLRKYNAQARLSERPSGHVAVDVMSFDPSGWSIPREAESAKLSTEQFALINCSFVNQSMISLEKASCEEALPRNSEDGAGTASSNDGPEGSGSTKDQGGKEAANSDTGPNEDAKGSAALEDLRRQAVQPHNLHRGLRPRRSLAARFLATAVAATVSSGPVSFYPGVTENQLEYAQVIKYAPKLTSRKSATPPTASQETCSHPAIHLKGGGNQYSKDVYCDLCKARWKHLSPWELKKAMEQEAAPTISTVMCSCGVPAHRWQVKKAGPTCNRHFFRCQKRLCEFFMWDPAEQAALGAHMGPAETQEQADMEMEAEQKMNVEIGRIQSQAEQYVAAQNEELEMVFERKMDRMRDGHQQEIAQLQQQMQQQAAWMQSYINQVNGGFEMVNNPQNQQASAAYGKESADAGIWPGWEIHTLEHAIQTGWLPRTMASGDAYLAIFEDQGGMIMWSEDFGKIKALPNGKYKQLKATTEKMINAWHVEKFGKVWEFVSPKYGLAESDNPIYEDHEVGLLWPMFPEMFWEMIGERTPEMVLLRPDKTSESLELACQAAEWQDARGKPFLMLLSTDCLQDVCDLTKDTLLLGRRELRTFSGGAAVMSNSRDLVCRLEPEMDTFTGVLDCVQKLVSTMHNESSYEVEVNDLHQNQKALQGDIASFPQNQEALQEDSQSFHQNQEALQGDSHVLMFDGSVRAVGPSQTFVEDAEGDGEGDPFEVGPVVQRVEAASLKPTDEEVRMLKRVHENLGHPSNRDFARTLRIAHCKPHLVRFAAKEFSCSTCASKPMPKPARPAVLPKSYQPGQVIGIDVMYLPALNKQESFPALNIVDWGSGYSMVERLKEMSADHVWRTFMRTWNGKTERAGAHYKHVFEKARDACVVTSWQELKTMMYEVEAARNRFGNRSGFSPMQRQLGWSLRLPGSMISDDPLDPQLMVQSAGDEVRRLLQLRQAAQEAYIKERKRKHAITPESREGRKPAWVGPGVVLAVDGPNLWISMRGELWKASSEQCRPATSEEQMAKELLAGELEALRQEFRARVQFEDPVQVPVPDGHDPDLDDYSPSAVGSQNAVSDVEEEPEREVSGGAHGPLELDLDATRSVEHNERLDGNGPGTPTYDAAWFSLDEERGWVFAHDVWENVNNDVVVRYHNVPRARLCNPNKVRGMVMPRRLKHRHTFMVYDDGRMEIKVDNWFKQRKNPGTTQESWIGFTVFSNHVIDTEAFASKPRGQGEVFDHEIKPEDRPKWDESDLQEWQKVEATGAIRVLSVEESKKVKAELAASGKSDRVLPSRMVRRFKPADQPGMPDGLKSRWCLRGDCDPDLLQRYSPTINSTTFGAVLQVTASMRFPASVGDLRNAFCQSGLLVRKEGKLYAAQPRGGIPGLHPEQIVEIVAGMYGLGDAPSHWRRTLKQEILKLGYRETTLDPTIYMLHRELQPGEDREAKLMIKDRADADTLVLSGVIAVEVDDLFTCGDSVHDERINALQKVFQFGKFEPLMGNPNGVSFNGRRIKQHQNFGLEIDMVKFVTERLSPVSLAKGRKSNPKELANQSEIGQLRAVIGSLNWCARECRPDAAAAASLGAASFPNPTIQDILDVNRAVETVKSRPELSIKIQPIPVKDLCWGVISDASFANAHGGGSQGAYGILAYHQGLHDGRESGLFADLVEKWQDPEGCELDLGGGDAESVKGPR